MKHLIMCEILIEGQDAWEHRTIQAKFLIYCQLLLLLPEKPRQEGILIPSRTMSGMH